MLSGEEILYNALTKRDDLDRSEWEYFRKNISNRSFGKK